MNGGIVQPSTCTFTSLRGFETLNTSSCLEKVPFRPVICSMSARLRQAPRD